MPRRHGGRGGRRNLEHRATLVGREAAVELQEAHEAGIDLRLGPPAPTTSCVALEGGAHFTGGDVARVLTRVGAERGLPAVINVDNGTEFTSRAMDQWAWSHGVQLDFSRPGKPTDNATIESFNASVRRESLSAHYFSTLAEAQVVLQIYRDEYNNDRPHSSLGQQTPSQCRTGRTTTPDPAEASLRVP